MSTLVMVQDVVGSSQTDSERFWIRVNKDGPVHPVLGTKCWLWTGALLKCNNGSYGRFRVGDNDGYLAHRYSYELNVGTIPQGDNVCHHCDNPTCVNPEHLFTGDNRKNAEDRDTKGRQVIRRGEEFTHAKLNDDAVRYIRKNYIPFHPVFSGRQLAKKFGVSTTVVKWVIQGKIWKHVKDEADDATHINSSN